MQTARSTSDGGRRRVPVSLDASQNHADCQSRTPIRTSKNSQTCRPTRRKLSDRQNHAVARRRARGGAGQRPGAADQAQCCQGAAKGARRRRYAYHKTPSTRHQPNATHTGPQQAARHARGRRRARRRRRRTRQCLRRGRRRRGARFYYKSRGPGRRPHGVPAPARRAARDEARRCQADRARGAGAERADEGRAEGRDGREDREEGGSGRGGRRAARRRRVLRQARCSKARGQGHQEGAFEPQVGARRRRRESQGGGPRGCPREGRGL